MFFINNVRVAIERAGGVTYVANQLKCSGSAVHSWIRKARVSNLDKAKRLAELAGMHVREIRP